MKKTLTITLISTILVLTTLPLILAYNGYSFDYFYGTPLDFLENEWVMFGIIFVILFGVIFYVLNKSFKNSGVAGAIGFALSLFITMAISQKGLLSQYGGGELSSWALLIGALIAIAFLIRFAAETFGRWGATAVVLIAGMIANSFEPYDILPQSLLNSRFIGIYEGIISWPVIIILAILAFALGKGGPKTVMDHIMKGLRKSTRR
tara:strand:+ start:216 stop:833 length:618 start_codon:yes stop_codon:yes gene_type:complete